jgi:hypothetical protein
VNFYTQKQLRNYFFDKDLEIIGHGR